MLWRWEGLAFGNTAAVEDPDGDGINPPDDRGLPRGSPLLFWKAVWMRARVAGLTRDARLERGLLHYQVRSESGTETRSKAAVCTPLQVSAPIDGDVIHCAARGDSECTDILQAGRNDTVNIGGNT